MTERRPPQKPPLGPLPPLDAYRPNAQHQGTPPATRPPQKYPPRPLPPGAQQQRRTVSSAAGYGAKDPDQGWGVAAYAGFALLGVAMVAGAGVGYLMLNPPVELIRNEVIAQVKAKTGRDLKIGGPTRFTVYPSIGVSMADVELSPPPGMSGRPLAAMSSLDINVGLLPLFSRRIEVERLILRQPVIELRTDKAGRKSWDVRRTADATDLLARRIELAQAATPNRATDARPAVVQGGQATNPLAGIEQISLKDVRIENGTVVWHDERTGARDTVSAVNIETGMTSIANPLEIKGNLVVKGERLDVSGSLGSLKAILDGRPSKLALNATNRFGNVGFDGALAASMDADGKLDFKSSNVRGLAALAGVGLGSGAGFGPATLTGRLKTAGSRMTLDDARLALDDVAATGTLGLDTGAARPRVSANLKVGELNLNPYIAARDGAASSPAAKYAPAGKSSATDPNAPGSIDDLLNRPAPKAAAPQVRGFTQRAGWSEEPIQLAGLNLIDADVKLQFAKLRYREIKVGPTRVSTALAGGILKTVFEDVEFYEGRGRGALTVDATGAVPRFGANVVADGVSALPLMKDAAGNAWLAGTAKISLAVTGIGGSQKAMMDSLAGKADVTFNNGAIVGWNLAQIIRGLKQGQFTGFDRVETAKTDFSEMSSTWEIAEGVAQNQDLKLNSPLVRVTGAGRVALGARQIDYSLKPKLVASLDGQGATQGLAGLEIPLKVRGSWDKPEIVPEIGGILKDPEKAIGAIKEIGKQFKGKNAGEIVGKVLGDNPETAKKANDLLNKLLKPK